MGKKVMMAMLVKLLAARGWESLLRKFVGLFVVLAVLAALPGFAESQAPGGKHTGASMHPEDVLALNIFVPEETFNGLFQDAVPENPLVLGIWTGASLSSALGAGLRRGRI